VALTFDPRCKKLLQEEYARLKYFNGPLCSIVEGLSAYVSGLCKKDVMVTCICRTQARNDEIYACMKEKARPKPRKTAHSVYAAIDLRSRGLEKHIPAMLDWLNQYNSSNANPTKSGRTAFFHEVNGHGPHFHVQYQLKTIKQKPLTKMHAKQVR